MIDETYNGWTNRETWAVAFHINNDQGWQEQVHEAVRSQMDEHDRLPDEVNAVDAQEAGDIIRENVEEMLDLSDDLEGDLIRPGVRERFMALWDIGSLYRVNWDELGAAFLADVQEQS